MLLFPVLGGAFSLAYAFTLLWPTVVTRMLERGDQEVAWGAVETMMTALTYLGLAFIATFFNTCTVFTAKTRFSGGDATFGDSIRFALSKIHLIFFWSVLAATIGVLLRALDEAAERSGGALGFVLGIAESLFGMAWSALTIFVVPVMVYEDAGPIAAVQRSAQVLKRTWGESLVRAIGFGVVQFLASLPGVLLILFTLMRFGALWPLLLLGVAWIVLVALAFNVAAVVFNTALYEYASTGRVPGGFEESAVRAAFAHRAAKGH